VDRCPEVAIDHSSLARPEGNLTGTSGQSGETAFKRVELARDIIPQLQRVALLTDPGDTGASIDARGVQAAGAHLGLYHDLVKLAAIQADKILRGAKPADLAWEQPTKFELVVNARTAKALGLRVPESIMLRTTKIIR
jgi:ABC-type uncharacterized transport system substrate-binding protein